MRLFLCLIVAAVTLAPLVAHATATPAASAAPVTATKTEPQAAPKPAPSTAINPLKRLENKTEEMMKGLDAAQAKQFVAIRTSHGAVRGVVNVRDSLDRAVKSCIKANPDLKEEMTVRFQEWKDTILPVVRQRENGLEKLILLQSFTRPSNVRAYLKIFDDAVKYQNAQITEVPVSSKEACEDMAENMDDSHERLKVLMVQTLGLDQNPEATPEKAKE